MAHVGLVGIVIGVLLELNLARLDGGLNPEDAIFGVTVFMVIALLLGWVRNRLLGFR